MKKIMVYDFSIQDFFETLISFIISQNNQIPRIKKLVNDISEKWGSKSFARVPIVLTISLMPEHYRGNRGRFKKIEKQDSELLILWMQ